MIHLHLRALFLLWMEFSYCINLPSICIPYRPLYGVPFVFRLLLTAHFSKGHLYLLTQFSRFPWQRMPTFSAKGWIWAQTLDSYFVCIFLGPVSDPKGKDWSCSQLIIITLYSVVVLTDIKYYQFSRCLKQQFLLAPDLFFILRYS